MDHYISKSEKKRLAKGVEKLTTELVLLGHSTIDKLPCDDFIKAELKTVTDLKAGARKRQVKFITKCLRKIDLEPLMDFLEEERGSKLKQSKSFHELERLRDDILTEAIEAMRQADHFSETLDSTNWECELISGINERFLEIDTGAIKLAALKYARSRKPVFSREIFRILKSAQEQQRYTVE